MTTVRAKGIACGVAILGALGALGCASISPAAQASRPCNPSQPIVEVKNSRTSSVDVYGFTVAPVNSDVRYMTLLGTATAGLSRLPSQGMTLFMYALPGDETHAPRFDENVKFNSECAAR